VPSSEYKLVPAYSKIGEYYLDDTSMASVISIPADSEPLRKKARPMREKQKKPMLGFIGATKPPTGLNLATELSKVQFLCS